MCKKKRSLYYPEYIHSWNYTSCSPRRKNRTIWIPVLWFLLILFWCIDSINSVCLYSKNPSWLCVSPCWHSYMYSSICSHLDILMCLQVCVCSRCCVINLCVTKFMLMCVWQKKLGEGQQAGAVLWTFWRLDCNHKFFFCQRTKVGLELSL